MTSEQVRILTWVLIAVALILFWTAVYMGFKICLK